MLMMSGWTKKLQQKELRKNIIFSTLIWNLVLVFNQMMFCGSAIVGGTIDEYSGEQRHL